MSIYDNIAFGIRLYEQPAAIRARRPRRVGAAPRGAVGRGQGQAAAERARPVGRPAAAPVHRPRDRGQAGDPAARRAGLGARPDLDPAHRGADRRAEVRLLHRHRHAQHAAGGAQLRLHRLHVSRRTDRIRRDRAHLHPSDRNAAPKTTSPAGLADGRDEHGRRTHHQELRRGAAAAQQDDRRDGRAGRKPARRGDRGGRRSATASSPPGSSRATPRSTSSSASSTIWRCASWRCASRWRAICARSSPR